MAVVDARGRSASAKRGGFSAGFRRRGRSSSANANANDSTASHEPARAITLGKSAGIVSRFRARSRSASTTEPRVDGRRSSQQDQNDEEPPSLDNPVGRASSAQIAHVIDQHQLALKNEMMEMMENQEREINFWKNKALKLKKRMAQQEAQVQDAQERESTNESSSTSNDDNGGLIMMVSALETEVANRDILIDSLRNTTTTHEESMRKMREALDTQERMNQERVQLLENQLERLVEMTTKVASSNSTQILADRRDSQTTADDMDPANEVAVLEQLLARVLAEKDKLLFENQNMRAILRETKSTSLADAMNASTEKDPIVNGNNNNTNKNKNDDAVDIPSKSMDEKGGYTIEYKMSCRNCTKNHSHVKYSGVYSGSDPNASQNLKIILAQHFSQIWKIVQEWDEEEDGSITSSVRAEEWNQSEAGGNIDQFQSSSLARHIARHCINFRTEGEVSRWCRDNVRVEVQQGLDDAGSMAESSKKSRRSSKKPKKGTSKKTDRKGQI